MSGGRYRKLTYTCGWCRRKFHPNHVIQECCDKHCSSKLRHKRGRGASLEKFCTVGAAESVRVRRAKARAKARAFVADCATKEDVFTKAFRWGYTNGASVGYRRGYAAGFSAAIGEKDDAA